MEDKEKLTLAIHDAFANVPFPHHQGLSTTIAIDNWESNPEVLAELTAKNDAKVDWWEIPRGELKSYGMQIYLDSKGVEFYLPAYMCLVIHEPTYQNYRRVIDWMNPRIGDEERVFEELFRNNFSRITGKKHQVCRQFLNYLLRKILDDSVRTRGGSGAKWTVPELVEMLEHDFWRTSSSR